MIIQKLSDLKPADYNPRKINDEAFNGLKFSIEEFGDISGITFNTRTGNLVAGHQRVNAILEKYGDVEIQEDKIVTPVGSFRIRVVDWDIQKEKAANIAANAETIQGEFTEALIPLVQEVSLLMPDVADSLRLNELDMINTNLVDENTEIDMSELQYKPQFGVIVICENETQQQSVFEKLQQEGYNLRVVTT